MDIIYNTALDIEIKSFTDVNGFIFPLRINISNIKYKPLSISFLKIHLSEEAKKDTLEINYENSPYKKQYEFEKYLIKLNEIYNFIDWELRDTDFRTLRQRLGISNVSEFQKWFLDCSFFSLEDIFVIYNEINYWIEYIKIDFINKVKKLFDLDKKQPRITLKDSDKTPKEYIPFLSYNYNMTSFQTASEFPMNIWFKENINKAYTDWSWREHEIKRMYITEKTRVENFRELVKAKSIEEYSKK